MIFRLICILHFFLTFSDVFAQQSKLDSLLTKLNSQERFDGVVLVSKGQKVLFHEAFGLANRELNAKNTRKTKIATYSVSKTFTAVKVLQLVEKGKLRLDQKIADFFPKYKDKKGREVTIQQLLTHTSGFEDFVNYRTVTAYKDFYINDFEKLLYNSSPKFTPGKKFSYSSTAYTILSFIIEKVEGVTFDIAMNSMFKKAGMMNTGVEGCGEVIQNKSSEYFINPDKDNLIENLTNMFSISSTKGAGAVYSTAEDIYKFDQALFKGDLINKDLLKMMLNGTKQQLNYGYGIVNFNLENIGKVYGHQGGFLWYDIRSIYYHLEKEDLCIVILTNTGMSESIWNEIVNASYKFAINSQKDINLSEKLVLE